MFDMPYDQTKPNQTEGDLGRNVVNVALKDEDNSPKALNNIYIYI